MKKRNIIQDSNCVFCEHHEENEQHLFRDCWLAAHIWKSGQLGINTGCVFNIPISEWIRNFMMFMWKENGHDSPRVRMFVATLWGIRIHRNNVYFRKDRTCPTIIINWIQKIFEEAENAISVKKGTVYPREDGSSSNWNREGEAKIWLTGQCNLITDDLLVDGAWRRDKRSGDSTAAIGWNLICNSVVVEEGSNRVRAHNALQAGALAMLEGLTQARLHGVNNITVKTDSCNLVFALKYFPDIPLEITSVCQDIISIAKSFRSCCIKKCPREVVSLAHNLATRARKTL